MSDKKHRLLLKHQFALGDTVLLTGLVRDIHRAYPNQYQIELLTNWTPVWWHNPHVVYVDKRRVRPGPKPQLVEVGWGDAIKWNSIFKMPDRSKQLAHILHWYHLDFYQKTGLQVPCTEPKGELFLTEKEVPPIIQGRYWVVMAGGKLDLTNKHWHFERYQEVVTRLRGYGLQFVQCGATHQNHVHPPLVGAMNMVGKTDNVRDFFNIIMHAEGVIAPVTAAVHIAAVYDKPCVVLSGGREEPWFEAYIDGYEAFGPGCAKVKVPHKMLHTLGQLYCCDKQGCWKKRTVPIDPDDLGKNAHQMCKEPVRSPNQAVPACMDLIQPDHVIEAVMEYYEEGILPPIGKPKGKYPAVTSLEAVNEDIKLVAGQNLQLEPKSAVDLGDDEGPPPIRIPSVEVLPPPDLTINRPPSGPIRQQRPHQQRAPQEFEATGPKGRDVPHLDNPIIGGKFTVCVLCWGPHPELAKRCIDSILTTLPRNRIDLRIATNEASPKTVEYVRSVGPDKLYINETNRKKYPVMREMFHDPRAPINTKYLLWFDDDSYVVDPRWATRLSEVIIANHKHGARLFGIKLFHDLSMYAKGNHNPRRWFEQATWFRGAHLRVRGQERFAPNGSCIDFAVGWFWAIETGIIKQADIPDRRLNHNGGDITIGAQVTQAGYKIKEFNKGKVFIFTPPKDQGGRRGYREEFPWSNKGKAPN